MLDGGDGAFVDLDLQRHTVARLRHHLGVDLGRVAPLGHVLALQLITHTFEGGTLEDLTFGQARLFQALHQVFGADRLVAFNLDARHRRALDHVDDQHIAIAAQLDVLEEPGLEQGTSRVHQAAVVGLVANVQRQGTEHTASGNPLQAVDANIGDGEGLGVNFSDHQCGHDRS